MLLFINPLAPAQLQPAHMQERACRSQDKQSQQHPRTVGGNAERAKDAPAEASSGTDTPRHRGHGDGSSSTRCCYVCAAATGGPGHVGAVTVRVGGCRQDLLCRLQLRCCCSTPAQKCPCCARGAAELLWGITELRLLWDPNAIRGQRPQRTMALAAPMGSEVGAEKSDGA